MKSQEESEKYSSTESDNKRRSRSKRDEKSGAAAEAEAANNKNASEGVLQSSAIFKKQTEAEFLDDLKKIPQAYAQSVYQLQSVVIVYHKRKLKVKRNRRKSLDGKRQ
ncbi:MAG: hypothetical protein ACI3YE_06985 [Candidatus Avispirillum sp.]